MVWRKHILLSILVLAISCLACQKTIVPANTENSSIHFFGGDQQNYGIVIRPTKDGGFIIIGGTNSFGAGSFDVFVIKLDKNLNTMWQHTYGGPFSDTGNDIAETIDGGYLLVCDTYNGTDPITNQPTKVEMAYIIKTNAEGNEEWGKRYNISVTKNIGLDKTGSQAYGVYARPDGNYEIMGNGVYPLSASGFTLAPLVFTLDNKGNEIDSGFCPASGLVEGFLFSVLSVSDSQKICCGSCQSVYNGPFYPTISVFNAKDSFLRDYKYTSGLYVVPNSIQNGKIISLKDSGYFIASTIVSGSGTAIEVLRVGADFKPAWDKTLPNSANKIIAKIKENGLNEIIIAYTLNNTPPSIGIMKLDLNGNTLWDKTYGSAPGMGANDLCIDANNNIVVLGTNGYSQGNYNINVFRISGNNGEIIK